MTRPRRNHVTIKSQSQCNHVAITSQSHGDPLCLPSALALLCLQDPVDISKPGMMLLNNLCVVLPCALRLANMAALQGTLAKSTSWIAYDRDYLAWMPRAVASLSSLLGAAAERAWA